MGNYLNIGNDGFSAIVKGEYVDKTELIKFVNSTLGTKEKLTCVSRPRRFGKSFAAQMLNAYYDKSCDSKELFQNYKIAENESFETYLNRYDVIYLDITWFISNAADIKDTVAQLQNAVVDELSEVYKEVKRQSTLPQMLAKIAGYTGSKFIIIIDEWDAIFREARNDVDLQKEYITLMRGLFKSSLTDKMIEAAYITGILPIKKYGTQSALTDFYEYTMLQPEPLEGYIGFTEDEVEILCQKSKLAFSEIREWYDGYVFENDVHVYNPKSVMEAVRRRRLGSYWTQTETYESLKIYIDMNTDGLKEAIVQMLGEAKYTIDIGTFQNDMTNIRSKDDVLTLLVHLGYLAYDEEEKSVFIPNKEVKQEFVRAVTNGRHREVAKLIQMSDRLLKETLNLNEEVVAKTMEQAHDSGTVSLYYNNEQALRSVIKFAYISCMDEFQKIEELPSGKGYADVVYLPKKGVDMPILLIELKWSKSSEGAIRQIKEKNYPQVLAGFGNEILLVGINYDEKSKKHTCKIEKYVMEQ